MVRVGWCSLRRSNSFEGEGTYVCTPCRGLHVCCIRSNFPQPVMTMNCPACVPLFPPVSAGSDWGHAKDYIKGMWLMVQRDEPSDLRAVHGRVPQRQGVRPGGARAHRVQ